MPRQLSTASWVCILLGASLAAGLWAYYRFHSVSSPPELPKVAFAGPSSDLPTLAVVPTLDTPLPPGKTVLWCSAFALAWRSLCNEVAREPIRLENAQDLADRLNASDHADTDLANGDVLAMAGLARQAFESRLQRRYRQLFADRPLPTLNLAANEVAAFAAIKVQQQFQQRFFANNNPMKFRDVAGQVYPVRSFGIFDHEQNEGPPRQRLGVEYLSSEEQRPDEWIVDLDRDSQPYQVLIARLPPQATFAQTWADLDAKRAAYSTQQRPALRLEKLAIPSVSFRLQHRFTELEGKEKRFLNPRLAGLHLGLAAQSVEFCLDRHDTPQSSEATLDIKPSGLVLLAEHPFLVVMKKRTAPRPFLMLWLATADFLEKMDGH
ncbi:MAG: hypothetical protein SNJ82_05680 [Gemmataceae bacterium]